VFWNLHETGEGSLPPFQVDPAMATDLITKELLLRHERSPEVPRHWAARDATGASVIRVFAKGTRPALLKQLVELPVEEIGALRTKEDFEKWFEAQLREVTNTLKTKNRTNERVQPGLRWGHGAKVLAIYVRSLVLRSRYFPDQVVNRVKPWLFVPVDGFLMKRLKACGVRPPFTKIREIATRDDFYFVQNLLAKHCPSEVSRVVFDDSWADRD
jgi:hypothetical protein